MRNIPTITKNLLIINILAYVAMFVFSKVIVIDGIPFNLNDYLGLHFFMASDFHLYQLFTYMFMHGGIEHILLNMFMLWMFGCVVENVWGAKRFLFYYIFCGVGAGLFQEMAQFAQFYYIASEQIPGFSIANITQVAHNSQQVLNLWTTVGASGAIYAILLAFGMLFPEQKMFIIPIPIPIKAKWIVIGSAVVELASAMGSSGDNIAHLAHLGGMVFGFFLIRYWQKHPFGGYYGQLKGEQFFENLKSKWEQRTGKTGNGHDPHPYNKATNHSAMATPKENDWDYNARKQQEQAEIDRILDKIRKSGYDSLTKEEKQKLFDQSNK